MEGQFGNENIKLTIAEIGINHNGDMNIAKQLITNAKKWL